MDDERTRALQRARSAEMAAIAGWLLAATAVLAAFDSVAMGQVLRLDPNLFFGEPSPTRWAFATLQTLSDWRFIATVLVCAGLGVWLRGAEQALARRLMTGAAVIGFFSLFGNPIITWAMPHLAPGEATARVLIASIRLFWLVHFGLAVAGVAAMGAGLDRPKAGVLYALAGAAFVGIAVPPLLDCRSLGAAAPDGSGGEWRGAVRLVIPFGHLVFAALAVIVARLASVGSSAGANKRADSALRKALLLVAGGLGARILLNIVVATQAAVMGGISHHSPRSDLLFNTATHGTANAVAALVPLAGAYLLWRAARGGDDQASTRFAWTFGNWSVALVFEVLSSGYATYVVLSDGHANTNETLLASVAVGGLAALFGLFGMMTLFGGLAVFASRYEGVLWQKYAERARRVPGYLGATVVIGVLVSLAFRVLGGGFRAPSVGVLVVFGVIVVGFALVVVWLVFSTLFGIVNRFVVEPGFGEPEELVSEESW